MNDDFMSCLPTFFLSGLYVHLSIAVHVRVDYLHCTIHINKNEKEKERERAFEMDILLTDRRLCIVHFHFPLMEK